LRKRILQFVGSFHQGGSERQAVSLARLLVRDGSYEVFAATLNDQGVLRGEIDELGLPDIPEFPLTSFFNPGFVKQVRSCAAYLRENQIDLIHSHDFYTNVFGMAAATLAAIPGRIASKRETGGMRSSGQEFVEKLGFGRAKKIVVNSDSVRRHLVDRGIPAQKIDLIYNGIDVERFASSGGDTALLSRQFGLPVGDNIRFVTIVANLRHDVKNIPMLLRCAKRVVTSHPLAHFVIAGEGELEAGLNEMANKAGVSGNVHFTGRCSDVPELVSASHICVLTSTAEGFSNSILEYMAAGRPVVATDVGGAGEAVVEGETGYLVQSDDDTAMAAHILDLLENEDKANEMGERGRKLVSEKFSEEIQLRAILKLYDSVLGEN
jgi:glycosyltransferase involved in cell wall biosynthesis